MGKMMSLVKTIGLQTIGSILIVLPLVVLRMRQAC